MQKRMIVVILGLSLISGAAGAVTRPMVGFLPFQGGTGTHRYAIPQSIYWQCTFIAGIGRTEIESLVGGMELDKQKSPTSLADTAAFSRLCAAVGEDFLVAGQVESQDKLRVRFRMIVYSAANPAFRKEHVHVCALSNLPRESIIAAREVAADTGVPVSSRVRFDSTPMKLEALPLFDQSLRQGADVEADASSYHLRSERLADRARKLCPSSSILAGWDLSFARYDDQYLDQLRKLHADYPYCVTVAGDIAEVSWYLDKRAEAMRAARKWLDLDRTSPGAWVITNGNAGPASSPAWRGRLAVAGTYAMMGDVKNLRPLLESLEKEHPESAYIRYFAGRMLNKVGDDASAVLEYQAALHNNPSSYRLRMRLVWAYNNLYMYEDAMRELKPALKQWPDRCEPHLYASRIYRARKQYDSAAAESKIVARLDPDSEASHSLLASDYMRSGNVFGSIRELSSGNSAFRQATAIAVCVLAFIFLIGIVVIAAFVRALLSRDRKPTP